MLLSVRNAEVYQLKDLVDTGSGTNQWINKVETFELILLLITDPLFIVSLCLVFNWMRCR